MSASVPSLPPALHPANILGNPVTTILGVTAAVQGVVSSLPGGAFPTNATGWGQFVLSLGIGLFGLFSR